ncbi:MAG: RNA polymerase sigma factor [Bacteroidetes bacterium]|nr:MAG: RNA polymerase sigma factor [Bacteroidota bacterium]
MSRCWTGTYTKQVALEQLASQWVIAAKNGDSRAMNALVQTCYPEVYRYAYRYFEGSLGRQEAEEVAADVAQRTFLSVYEHLADLGTVSRFRPWLYRIATNCCHEEARRRKRRRVFPWGRQAPEGASSSEPGPETLLQRHERQEVLREALSRLPDVQRTVILLKEYQGLTFREIAETLKISENTAKSRLYYGLKALRKDLERTHPQALADRAWYREATDQ